MFSHLTPEELGGYELNDIWGWKDQQTEKLYAIVGLTDGISFVDITNLITLLLLEIWMNHVYLQNGLT